jgi:hypothetical protein
MTERKNQPKQRLRKQPRMRRVYSATATPMPDMSMSKTVRKRKRRNSRQRFQRPVSGAKAVILNTRWISLAVMVVCAYALFLIGGDDRFYLNYIPVEGATSIEINHIVAESDLAGRHIFAADPQEAADDIGSMGGIVTATVTLHWPNDVMIRIREKPPLATWQEGEQTYWIDEDGQLSAARAQTVGLLNIVSEIPLASAAEDETILDEEEAAVEAEQGTTADEIPEDASTEEVESEEPAQEPGSQAAFVPAPVLAGALQLRELRPNIDRLYYQPADGLGYQDGRGWRAYFGTGRDMQQKLVVYETIVANLLERGIRPEYISVANQHKPYYRQVP